MFGLYEAVMFCQFDTDRISSLKSLCQVGAENSQTLASIANAVQIQVMNYIYSFIANALSERENHRTDTQAS